jgi:lysophospholipase L1-like esterase
MRLGLILATVMVGFGIEYVAAAEKAPNDFWIGSWGYVSSPLPPGFAPPATTGPAAASVVPFGEVIAQPPRQLPAPLLENPGNVPIDTASGDLINVTVRQLVRVSAGGRQLRLRFSNEGGVDPLVFGSVHVATAGADGAIVAGSDHVVSFAGKHGVIIPAGAPLLSDPVDLTTNALDKLYISIHLQGPLPARAPRILFQYVAGEPGDFSGAAELPKVRLMRVPCLLTLVEVQPTQPTNVIVALGDSITEGATSTANAFRSWPDRLAERLAQQSTRKTTAANWAVVNAGIGGNRLLRYGSGPDALARLDRDVLSVPGVKVVILLEGINDIGRGFITLGNQEPVTLEALQAADLQIIARAHEHGIKVIGATLTPYQGAFYAAPEGELVRQGLNNWIKSGGAFDGVIDFAPAVADKDNPLTFAKAYNDRDHLHPNDAGYKAMADAIDLSLLAGK